MTRKAPMAFAVAGLMTLALGACSDDGPTVSNPSAPATSGSQGGATPSGGSESSSPPSSPSTSETSEETSSAASEPLAKGDCLGPKPSYERVKCSEPHDYEVFYAKGDTKYSDDLVKRGAWSTATCYTQGAKFLGNEGFGVTRLAVESVPQEANPDNSKRVACMAKEYRTSGRGLASSTSSLKGKLKGNGFYNYNLCAKNLASDTDMEIVVCTEPHSSEAIGGKLNGKPGDPYPKDGKKIHAAARKFCKPLAAKFLGGARSDIAYAENSGGKKPWSEGKMISGCFVEIKDKTKVTKTMKGIGDKPISSLK